MFKRGVLREGPEGGDPVSDMCALPDMQKAVLILIVLRWIVGLYNYSQPLKRRVISI